LWLPAHERQAQSGKRIPQVPDWTFTAGANYVRSLFADLDGFLNLQYFTRSGGVQEADQVAQRKRSPAKVQVSQSCVSPNGWPDSATEGREALAIARSTEGQTSSVITFSPARVAAPKVVAIATSVASRP